MRDLRQDLEDYHRYTIERSLSLVNLSVDALPHAIDRALRGENLIKGLNKELADAQDQRSQAEDEVERLKLMVKSITGGLDEAIETVQFLEAENTKLCAVVDAAKEWINCPCEDIRECLECTAFKFRNALAELDGEGER